MRGGKRQAILKLLKQHGASDSATLASHLGISAMAVRQHLYLLSAAGVVTYQEQPSRLGRPAKMWDLTPAAAAQFPDGHAGLAGNLLGAAEAVFGGEGVGRMLSHCAQRQIAEDCARLGRRRSLRQRLAALVVIRNAEGYMAEVLEQVDGSFLLVHNHCPIAVASALCEQLCDAEMEVYRGILGKRVLVSRSESMMAGARRCSYRIAIPLKLRSSGGDAQE